MEVWGGNRAIEQAVSLPGIDAWVCSAPYRGDAGGGDIHYLSMCAAGIIGRFALADVAGHGAEADALANELRSLMRRSINTADTSRLARSLNRSFGRLAQGGRFATAVLATYHAPTDHLIVVNAGHPRPLWYKATTGRWSLLKHDAPERSAALANLPLGLIDLTDYQQFAVPLSRGDIVVLYTDAMIEAADQDGRLLGEDGLLEIAMRADPSDPMDLGRQMIGAVDAHRGADVPRDDDVTLMVLHHNGADPPPQSLGQRIRVTARMLGLPRRSP
jgi:serine phosphatase RsbU (regulator of sigma subunit)